MRGIQLILLMVVSASAAGSAQLPVAVPQTPSESTTATREDVVARLMSFDVDADGKVAKDELGERMKSLVTRGDGDRDGVLDENEIRNLARTPLPGGGSGAGFPGMYQVPAESWFPDRPHIEGALADLKLESDAYARAIEAVDVHQQHVDAARRREAGSLLRQMESVLNIEQLARLQTALERHGTTGFVTFRGAGNSSAAGVAVRNVVLQQVDGKRVTTNVRQTFIRLSGADLGHFVDQAGLTPDRSREAHAALERYRASLRAAGEAERACLVEQMNEIMTAVERDDFRAALARRSAVPIGVMGDRVVNSAVRIGGAVSVAPPIAAPAP